MASKVSDVDGVGEDEEDVSLGACLRFLFVNVVVVVDLDGVGASTLAHEDDVKSIGVGAGAMRARP